MLGVGEVGVVGRQAMRVAGVLGGVAKELLVEEGEGLVLRFWGVLKSPDLVGGLSRLVEEEVEAKLEEEEQGGEEWG